MQQVWKKLLNQIYLKLNIDLYHPSFWCTYSLCGTPFCYKTAFTNHVKLFTEEKLRYHVNNVAKNLLGKVAYKFPWKLVTLVWNLNTHWQNPHI